jgi:hypothetical protein
MRPRLAPSPKGNPDAPSRAAGAEGLVGLNGNLRANLRLVTLCHPPLRPLGNDMDDVIPFDDGGQHGNGKQTSYRYPRRTSCRT